MKNILITSLIALLIGAGITTGIFQILPTRRDKLVSKKEALTMELSVMENEFSNQESKIQEKQSELYTITCDLARERQSLKEEVSLALIQACGGF